MGEDIRSVHFLPFPSVRQEYFNPDIERRVLRLQSVIELARAVRAKADIPIKVSAAWYSFSASCSYSV